MITKNKEEIENSSISVFDIFDELDNRYGNKDWSVNEAVELGIEKATIKTSILWCEAWINHVNWEHERKELQTHLNWLKEQK